MQLRHNKFHILDLRWEGTPSKFNTLMFYGSQKVRLSLLPGGSWHCLTWKCRQREGAEIKIFMYNMYGGWNLFVNISTNNGFRYISTITYLVPMKPICWVAQRDVKFGLGVHQDLQTVVIS